MLQFTRLLAVTATSFVSTSVFAASTEHYVDAFTTFAEIENSATSASPRLKKTYDLHAIAAGDATLSIRKGSGDEPDAMVMLSDVLFEFGDDKLAPTAVNTLSAIAQKLEGVDGLQITGHTDSIGSEAINEQLGLARAQTVRNWLVSSGYLDENSIDVLSAGETDPIAPNVTDDGADDADGRALNRRVEFSIIEKNEETARLTSTGSSAI